MKTTLKESHAELLKACKAQHAAIDYLFAKLIEKDEKFYPSQSGQPWQALVNGNVAIKMAEELTV